MTDRSMFYGALPPIFQYAYQLRKNMTDAEKLLWEKLRKNKLGFRFKAQHPIDIFIADFYCHKLKLVIEIDGKIHKTKKEYDDGRSFEMEELGIKVIRFTNKEVINGIDEVVNKIKLIMKQIAPEYYPLP